MPPAPGELLDSVTFMCLPDLFQWIDLIVAHVSTLHLTWWCHQMETFSALLAICSGNSRVTGELPAHSQWRGALVFSLIFALNKRLGKQSWGWWFETPSRPLWHHRNGRIYLVQPDDFFSPTWYITENIYRSCHIYGMAIFGFFFVLS